MAATGLRCFYPKPFILGAVGLLERVVGAEGVRGGLAAAVADDHLDGAMGR